MKLLPLLLLLPLSAQAATLRPYTALDGAVVRLNDLFDGSDDRPLGPAPEPGRRIVVESPQLSAIARMFGVDWRPAGPGDRAVLERPGRTLLKDDVLPPLRALLTEAGAPRDSEIDLPLPGSAPFPAHATPALDFSALEYDAASGRFTTLLQLATQGAPPQTLRLSGRVQPMVELPVTRRAMLPGDIVLPSDLQWTRMRAALARGQLVHEVGQAAGQALRRSVPAGQPLALADLGRPVLVQKGAPLALSLDGPGIALTAQAVATEPGGMGEHIRVTNPVSRATLEAEITGPGTARVVPGTARAAGTAPFTTQLAAR